jgi:hypothetical protein
MATDLKKEDQYEMLRAELAELPESNLNVVLALLRVVSKIVAYSTQNKMTPQNLATCLAPVILRDKNVTSPDIANIAKANAVVELMFRNA